MRDMNTSLLIAKATPPPQLNCPWCTGPVDVKSRHVSVAGSAVKVYCSKECLQAAAAGVVARPAAPEVVVAPRPRPRRWQHVGSIIVGLGVILLFRGDGEERPIPALHLLVSPAASQPARALAPEPASQLGPTWPPTESDWVQDLGQDAWLHPLAGPTRRMPKHHSRVFGAERPGERPGECQSGHCGVDVGGEIWGEAVLAVHDGVVDRVNRGPNEEHGGVYVRIAHRHGTVFTQYFHLAAVPRWIKEKVEVKRGQVVGLLGDTGVQRSAPHLHFTISVKPSKDLPEQYIDPEPLIALWPLFMPEGMGNYIVSTVEPPGLPVAKRKGKKKRKKDREDSAAAAFVESAPAAAVTAPSDTGDSSPPPPAQ